MKNVLGVKVGHHDPGAAIVTKDGRLFAISEERLNRIKHSTDIFPTLSIDYVLAAAGLTFADVDIVAMDRVTHVDVKKRFLELCPPALRAKEIVTVNHHDAHAASSAYCSGFDDCLVAVIDGAGEALRCRGDIYSVEAMTMYEFKDGKLREIEKVTHDRNMKNSQYFGSTGIGKIYTMVTRYLGFATYQEGKTMGLAPYGGRDQKLQARLARLPWARVIKGRLLCNNQILYPLGTGLWDKIWVRMKYVYYALRNVTYWLQFRKPTFIRPILLDRPMRERSVPLPDVYYTEVAFFAQKLMESTILESIAYFQKRFPYKKICTAGGVALNIDTNSRIMTDLGFEDIFTQPAASDTGVPLGSALYVYYQFVDYRQKKFTMQHAYLGRTYSEADILDALQASSLHYARVDNIAEVTAQLLAQDKIIAWYQGAAEYGPRALGNRSIIMSPCRAENKDTLNLRVKKRESFRPFAPIACLEHAREYFHMPAPESRFMLLVAIVKDEYVSRIPAVTHVDLTARVQTLTRDQNPVTYELIKQFGDRTGIYVLLNTSFNVAGEPIVETPRDAIQCYHNGGMDYLIMGNYLASTHDLPVSAAARRQEAVAAS